jgi:hypothetical protein
MHRLALLGTLTLTLTLALAACGLVTGPESDLRFSSAVNTCGPTDGPAVLIRLSAREIEGAGVSEPYLSLNIWSPVGSLSGRTFRLAQNSSDGFAAFYADDDRRTGLASGTVRVTDVGADSSIIGRVDVTLKDGTRVARVFIAPWRRTTGFCG